MNVNELKRVLMSSHFNIFFTSFAYYFDKVFRPRSLMLIDFAPNERPHKLHHTSKFLEDSSFGSHFRDLQKLEQQLF